ncbi:hypothetical protein J4416_02540 [Candidatus Pacearchaeota archaeon]|nr:hypothetical protein [Candidatus Pacearchaeota archaeon]
MKFKNFVLGLGIFIVFALAFFQGLETFYPTPQYDDYCSNRAGPLAYKIDTQCANIPDLQKKAEQCWDSKGDFVYEYDSNGCAISGYCDGCRIDYESDLDVHSSRVFIISIIIGILVFVAGFFLLSTEPVGSALMSGGIWAVFYGVVKNWRNFSESWRFLLLFVLLIVLIWLALRFNRKTSGFSKIKRKFRRR